jgi:hypothetical protein
MNVTVGAKPGTAGTLSNQDAVMQSSAAEDGKGGARKSTADQAAVEASRGGLASLKDPTQAHENLEIAKNVPMPQARFGHTITMVNRYKVVLFGGATGDTGKYSMTGETFIFNMFLKTWTELNGK